MASHLDPHAKFVICSLSREQIAKNANGWARRLGIRIVPFDSADERLTDEVCRTLAAHLPVDYGNPSADSQEKLTYLELMEETGSLTPEQISEHFGDWAA